jgi:hypothetical protein
MVQDGLRLLKNDTEVAGLHAANNLKRYQTMEILSFDKIYL